LSAIPKNIRIRNCESAHLKHDPPIYKVTPEAGSLW
jgi:hypothetical protein